MTSFPITLEQYLQAPTERPPVEFPPQAAKCFSSFFAPWQRVSLFKWGAVTKSKDELIRLGCLEEFSLHRERTRKDRAYMKDSGDLYLSRGFLVRHSPLVVLSVFCHELAHIKLSQTPEYPEIKCLQRAFKIRFADERLCEVMSPIEMYAVEISLRLLKDLLTEASTPRQRRQLRRIIADIEKKESRLVEMIHQLQYN